MGKIISFIAGIIGLKALKITALVVYFLFLFSFLSFVANSIIYFYNSIHDFFTYISTSSTSTDLSKFFGLLSCIGFTDAFLSALPFIFTSIIFLLTRYLYVVTNGFFSNYINKAFKV